MLNSQVGRIEIAAKRLNLSVPHTEHITYRHGSGFAFGGGEVEVELHRDPVAGLDNNLTNSQSLSEENKQLLLKLISAKLLEKPTEEWESIFRNACVPASVIRNRKEWLLLDPLLRSGIFAEQKNKRSTLTIPGRKILNRLIRWADVIIHNTLDDTAQELGITHEQLKAINPKVVSCQLSCLGGSRHGGWEMTPGFDNMVQAVCGMMNQFGSPDNPQTHGGTASADIMGGLSLTYCALLGVYEQRTSGRALEGRTSLARAINFLQLPYMYSEVEYSTEKTVFTVHPSGGQSAKGRSWWNRLYECRDAWIYVATPALRKQDLAKQVVGSELPDEGAIESAFQSDTCEAWLQKLQEADIACHRVLTVEDLYQETARSVESTAEDETATGAGEVFCWHDHPCGKTVVLKAPDWVRIGEQQNFTRLQAMPRFGEQSRSILKELNYPEAEVETLIQQGIVHEFLPALGNQQSYFYNPTTTKRSQSKPIET